MAESAHTYGDSSFCFFSFWAACLGRAQVSPLVSKKNNEAIKKIGNQFRQDRGFGQCRRQLAAYLGHLKIPPTEIYSNLMLNEGIAVAQAYLVSAFF